MKITTPYYEVHDEGLLSKQFIAKERDFIDILNIHEIHNLGIKGSGIKIGVIDTGIDENHIEISKNLKGYIDVTGEGKELNYTFDDIEDNPILIRDVVMHGTHVLSTMSGWKNMVGVCPEAEFYHAKALKNDGSGSDKTVVKAGDKLIEKFDVNFLSLSLGGNSYSPLLAKAVKRWTSKGVIVFCAAGNDGKHIDFPAAFPETIGVAALGFDTKWYVAPFSSPSTKDGEVNIATLGIKVRAAIPYGGYEKLSGTSMACPIACGCAVLWASAKKASTRKKILEIYDKTSLKNFPKELVGSGILQPNIFVNRRVQSTIHPKLIWLNKLFYKLF